MEQETFIQLETAKPQFTLIIFNGPASEKPLHFSTVRKCKNRHSNFYLNKETQSEIS